MLDGPVFVTVSPDGANLYATTRLDHSLVVFDRDSVTGALTYVEAKSGIGGSSIFGLQNPLSAAVSPDGRNVHVAGFDADAVAVFARDASTGAVTWIETHEDNVGGVDGLSGAKSVTVSPDGMYVYAAGYSENTVVAFRRDPVAGALTFLEFEKDGVGGVNGLSAAQYVAASPDADHLYVAGFTDDAVAVFESKGPLARQSPPTFIMTWGSTGSGPGQFDYPAGLAVGSVFVVDVGNHRVQKFDEGGNLLVAWGSQGSANGYFDNPADVAVDPSGNVYVVDRSNDRIQVFDPNGTYLRQWGSSGTADGQFADPRAVAVDSSSKVYVVDWGNHRVQKFNQHGSFLGKWGTQGTGPGQLMHATGIAVSANGDVFVSDSFYTDPQLDRIQRFSSNGAFLGSWGAGPSSEHGRFYRPTRIGVDSGGNVYVPDYYNHRIQKFDRYGNFLLSWGTSGTTDGLLFGPAGVAIDSKGRIYVSDSQNDRIQVFGYPTLELFIGETPESEHTLWLSPPSPPEGVH
jgi:DNA-binding beta-propeller fold protein YncE